MANNIIDNPKTTVNASVNLNTRDPYFSPGYVFKENGNFKKQSRLTDLPIVEQPPENLEVGFGDMALGVAAGASDFVAGASELLKNVTGYGETVRDASTAVADFFTANMSEDAQAALASKIFDESPEGDFKLGGGANEPAVYAMKIAQGLGSMVPMLAAGGVTGFTLRSVIGKAAYKNMIAKGATPELAKTTAKMVANNSNIAQKAATTAAIGTGGAGSLGSVANESRQAVLAMDHQFLGENSTTYKDAVKQLASDPSNAEKSPTEILDMAREETANYASLEMSKNPTAIAGAAVAMLGDKFLLGAVTRRTGALGAGKGFLGGAGKGGFAEGVTETIETGMQRYAGNVTSNKVAGTNIDPMKNVLSEGAEGGVIGFATGGMVGGVGGALQKGESDNTDVLDELNNNTPPDENGPTGPNDPSIAGNPNNTPPDGNGPNDVNNQTQLTDQDKITLLGKFFTDFPDQEIAFTTKVQDAQGNPQQLQSLEEEAVQLAQKTYSRNTINPKPTMDIPAYQRPRMDVPTKPIDQNDLDVPTYKRQGAEIQKGPDAQDQQDETSGVDQNDLDIPAYQRDRIEQTPPKEIDQNDLDIPTYKRQGKKLTIEQDANAGESEQDRIDHDNIRFIDAYNPELMDRLDEEYNNADPARQVEILDSLPEIVANIKAQLEQDAQNNVDQTPPEETVNLQEQAANDRKRVEKQNEAGFDLQDTIRETQFDDIKSDDEIVDQTNLRYKNAKDKLTERGIINKESPTQYGDVEYGDVSNKPFESLAGTNVDDRVLPSESNPNQKSTTLQGPTQEKSRNQRGEVTSEVTSSVAPNQSDQQSQVDNNEVNKPVTAAKKEPHPSVSQDTIDRSKSIIDQAKKLISDLSEKQNGKLKGIRSLYSQAGFSTKQIETALQVTGHETNNIGDFERFVRSENKNTTATEEKSGNKDNVNEVGTSGVNTKSETSLKIEAAKERVAERNAVNQKLKDQGIDYNIMWQGDLVKQRAILSQINSRGYDVPQELVGPNKIKEATQFINDFANSKPTGVNENDQQTKNPTQETAKETPQKTKNNDNQNPASNQSDVRQTSKLDQIAEKMSQAEKDAYADLKAYMDANKGTFNSGIDPILIGHFSKAAAFTLMKGSVKLAQWVRDTITSARATGFNDQQINILQSYLKQTYGAIKAEPEKYGVTNEVADQMSSSSEVRSVSNINDFVESQLKEKKQPLKKEGPTDVKKPEPETIPVESKNLKEGSTLTINNQPYTVTGIESGEYVAAFGIELVLGAYVTNSLTNSNAFLTLQQLEKMGYKLPELADIDVATVADELFMDDGWDMRNELVLPDSLNDEKRTHRLADELQGKPFLTEEEGKQNLAEWKRVAKESYNSENQYKTILSLFDSSSEWVKPYIDAGYNVIQFDLNLVNGSGYEMDLNKASYETFVEDMGIEEVTGILAACPCTDFSSSGARWWKGKDLNGDTEGSVALVDKTLEIVEYFKPTFWAIENPVGRMSALTDVGHPLISLQPHQLGNNYTKRTQLYGNFNSDMPTNNVYPRLGSVMQNTKRGDNVNDKFDRSTTPEGLAYSFFMANGADRSIAYKMNEAPRNVNRTYYKGDKYYRKNLGSWLVQSGDAKLKPWLKVTNEQSVELDNIFLGQSEEKVNNTAPLSNVIDEKKNLQTALQNGTLHEEDLSADMLTNLAGSLKVTNIRQKEGKEDRARRLNKVYLGMLRAKSLLGKDKLTPDEHTELKNIANLADLKNITKKVARGLVVKRLQDWIDRVEQGAKNKNAQALARSKIKTLKDKNADIPIETATTAGMPTIYTALDRLIASMKNLDVVPGMSSPLRTKYFNVLGNLHSNIALLPQVLKVKGYLGRALEIIAAANTENNDVDYLTGSAFAQMMDIPSQDRPLNLALSSVIWGEDIEKLLTIATPIERAKYYAISKEMALKKDKNIKDSRDGLEKVVANNQQRDKRIAATMENGSLNDFFDVLNKELFTDKRDALPREVKSIAMTVPRDVVNYLAPYYEKEDLDNVYFAFSNTTSKISDEKQQTLFPELARLQTEHDASDMHVFDKYLAEMKYMIGTLTRNDEQTDQTINQTTDSSNIDLSNNQAYLAVADKEDKGGLPPAQWESFVIDKATNQSMVAVLKNVNIDDKVTLTGDEKQLADWNIEQETPKKPKAKHLIPAHTDLLKQLKGAEYELTKGKWGNSISINFPDKSTLTGMLNGFGFSASHLKLSEDENTATIKETLSRWIQRKYKSTKEKDELLLEVNATNQKGDQNDNGIDPTRPNRQSARKRNKEIREDGSQSDNGSNGVNSNESLSPSNTTDSLGSTLRDGRIGRDTRSSHEVFTLNDKEDVSKQTPAVRVESNIEAIRTLRQIQKEQRPATHSEKIILARYTGWGALGNIFDKDTKHKYLIEGKSDLDDLVTKDEENSIRESLGTAFYTSKEVVNAMWSAVEAFNLNDGGKINVVEPTVGSGNFIGYQPTELRTRSNWSASEIDTITGNIARLIYADANVLVKGFEKTPFKPGAFSLAIGNPPFGSNPVRDRANPHLNGQHIHNYIIGKSADLLHDNGLVMMVVSNGFMDSDLGHHQKLDKRLEFLGAVRLPNNAFKDAGTQVVTDIVVMRKRAKGEAPQSKIDWTNTQGLVNGLKVNKYFQDNPYNVLGRVTNNGSMYGDKGSMTVEATDQHAKLGESITSRLVAMSKGVNTSLTADAKEALINNVMLTESELPLYGMMIDKSNHIRRRVKDDANGAKIITVTKQSIWSKKGEITDQLEKAITANDNLKFQQIINQIVNPDTKRPRTVNNLKAIKMATDYFYNNISTEIIEQKYIHSNPTKTAVVEALKKYTKNAILGEDYALVESMLLLRNTAESLLEAERNNADNIEPLRKQLNQQYNTLLKNKPKKAKYIPSIKYAVNIMRGSLGIETGLDSITSGKVKKADLFTERQMYPENLKTTAKNLDDAVTISIQQMGRVSSAKIAELLEISKPAAQDMLIGGDRPFLMRNYVTDELQFIDDYLAGNVKEKYTEALVNDDEKGAKLLKSAFPQPITAAQITPTIKAVWADPDIFSQFSRAIGITNAKTTINRISGAIDITGLQANTMTDIGAKFINAHVSVVELMNLASNGKTKSIYDMIGQERVKNVIATKQVSALINEISDTFSVWANGNEKVMQTLADNYNEKVNVWAERKYNGSLYMKPQGMRNIPGFNLRPTQLNGAMRMVMNNAVLLDHVVGAGKTFTAIVGVMERKRLGLSKKPLVVVPNHVMGSWRKDFAKLYPGANILYPGKDDLSAQDRAAFLSRIATGNYDAIILGHSHLTAIENDLESIRSVTNEQLKALRYALQEAKDNAKEAGGRARSVTQIENSIKALNDKLKAKEERAAERSDNLGYNFKDLGIDYMVIDESHEYKNLAYSTSRAPVVGMNPPVGSLKATDLLTKIRHVQNPSAVSNGGVTFLTGTPISNSLVEIYSISNYLARPSLDDLNIGQYDAFAGTFLQTANSMEFTPQGTVVERVVLKSISNGKGLSDFYRQYADVVSMEDLHRLYAEMHNGERFPVPRVRGGTRQIDSAPAPESMQLFNDYLITRQEAFDAATDKQAYSSRDNALWIMNDARKAGLDIRLVDPQAAREPTGKISRATKRIVDIYHQWDHVKGAQAVFSDMGTPSKGSRKNAINTFKAILGYMMSDAAAKVKIKELETAAKARNESGPLAATALEIGDMVYQRALLAEGEKGYLDSDAMESIGDLLQEAQDYASTADTGFSVYDDLRKSLVESGIPENEIAFVHEYDASNDKKDELFDMVNKGEIRVVIGSTKKMGAGTNMQERLVALHHLDAPWKSSDIAQREGRIIRQENALYEADRNFMVDIIAYTTDGSSDVVMWQILERKATAINSFRLGNAIGDVKQETTDSQSYADLKSTASGNPVYKDKVVAENELIKAGNEYIGLSSGIGGAQVTVEEYQNNVDKIEKSIAENEQLVFIKEESWFSEFNKQYNQSVIDFNAAQRNYDKKNLEFKEMSKNERKQKNITKPTQPKLKSVLEYNNPYSNNLNTAINQAQAQLDKAVLLPTDVNKVVTIKTEPQFYEQGTTPLTNGLVLMWSVTKQANQQAITELAVTAKTDSYANRPFTRFSVRSGDIKASSTLTSLHPGFISRKVDSTQQRDKYRLENSHAEYQAAQKLVKNSNIKPVKDRLDKARKVNDWLQTEIEFTNLTDAFRRSEASNRFVESDVRRNLRQSTRPFLERSEIMTMNGEKYTFYHGLVNEEFSTSAVGLSAKNEYVQAKIGREKVNNGAVDQTGSLYVSSISRNDNNQSTTDIDNLDDLVDMVDKQTLENAKTDKEPLDQPSFVRSPGNVNSTTAASLSKAAVEKIALRVTLREGFNSPDLKIVVVETEKDLNQDIQDRIKGDNAEGDIQGVLYKNIIYLVADAHVSATDVEKTFFHEVLGHYGLRNLLGDNLIPQLKAIGLRLKGINGVRDLAKEFDINLRAYENSLDKMVNNDEITIEQASHKLFDELFAHVAQYPEINNLNAFEKILSKLRYYFSKVGLMKLAKFSKNDLITLVSQSRNNLNKQSIRALTAKQGNLDNPTFNKKGKTDINAKVSAEQKQSNDVMFSRTTQTDQAFQDDLDRAMAVPDRKTRFQKVMSHLSSGTKRIAKNKNVLAALTLHQLSEVAQKKVPQLMQFYETVEKMLTKRNILADRGGNLSESIRQWAINNKEMADRLFKIAHAATVAGVDPAKGFAPLGLVVQNRLDFLLSDERFAAESDQGQEVDELNQLLDGEADRQAEWEKIQTEYNKLSEDAKFHYKAMRDEYTFRREELERLIFEQLENSKLNNDTKKRRKTDIKTRFELQRVQAPYFPLTRFGDYWIKVKDSRGSMRFYMYETEKEQQDNVKKMRTGGFKPTYGFKTDDNFSNDGASMNFITDLMAGIDEQNITNTSKETLKDMAYQMYLQALPSRSIRKQSIHRKATKGWSEDALRALASNLIRSSNQLSRMEYAEKLQKHVNEAKTTASKLDDNMAGKYADELIKRHEWVLNPTHSTIAQYATSVGFFMMLGFSTSSALVNASQNFVLGIPVISANFPKANVTAEMLKVMAKATPYALSKNFAAALSNEQLRAYHDWHDKGILQDTQTYSLAGLAENESLNYNPAYERFMQRTAFLFQQAEVFNRRVSALTVFNIARRSMSYEKAVKLAGDLTKEIHFEYTNANRARFMQGPTSKVLFQFKQYSQQVTYYMYRNLYQSFKGATAEDKRIARHQLAGTLAITTLLGGVGALPYFTLPIVYTFLNVLNAAFGDDDEPYNAETEVFDSLNDMFGGNKVLVNGLLGAGITNRISLGDLWIRDNRRDMSGSEKWANYAQQGLGPVFGGVAVSYVRAIDDFQEGRWERGIERILPKVGRDLFKAGRYAVEGAQSYSGVPYKKAEDFSIAQLLTQAIGFADKELSENYDSNSRVLEYKTFVMKRKKDLLSALYVANQQNDVEMRKGILLNVQKFNRRYPSIAISNATIKRSHKAKRRNEQRDDKGLRIKAQFLRELTN